MCSLPIDPGPCRGSVPSFGFSIYHGNCQPFTYGGCDGNENRFSTLAECETSCGGALSSCPPHAPWNFECSEAGKICTYDFDDCLCSPTVSFQCPKIDPTCTRPAPDGGISEIIVVAYTRCTCESGIWNCQVVTTGGR